MDLQSQSSVGSVGRINKNAVFSCFRIRLFKQWDLQVMVIPSVIFILIFSYLPMWGVLISFQEYNPFKGMIGSPWVGLKHFHAFFTAPEFVRVMRNTIVISLLKLMIGFPAPIILALMLNEITSIAFKRFVQTVTYLPHFISWVIVSGFVFSLLSVDNGSINILLVKLHIITEPLNWLTMANYFWSILVSVGVWKEVGFGAIIYLAAIAAIDPSIYESAAIDGASRFQKIFMITIPSIAPMIFILLILNVASILNAGFEDILLLTNNGTNAFVRSVSDVIDTYVYRMGLQNSRYSYAAAAGLFKALTSFILLYAANGISRRFTGSSLF